MRTAKCDYCSAESIGARQALTYMHGIKHCAEHLDWTIRDIAAYLHARDLISVEDFLERFPLLSDVSIKVPRRDGSVTDGAKVLLSDREVFRFVRLASS